MLKVGTSTIMFRRAEMSLRLCTRTLLVTTTALLLLAAIVVLSTCLGTTMIHPAQAIATLLGQGSADHTLIIWDMRLPRIMASLVGGAGLGFAGCLTQALARNRLATPNMLGINDGAMLAMVIMLLLGSNPMQLPNGWWLAPLGAIGAATLLLLAMGGIKSDGQRIIVAGLGLTALLRAINELALSRTDIQHASALYTWSIGSYAGRDGTIAIPAGIGIGMIMVIALAKARQINLLRFDQDIAQCLGADGPRLKTTVIILAVTAAGLGVAVGGPIAFIAMVSPILADYLVASAKSVPFLISALIGAILICTCDTSARVLAQPQEIPAGVITSILGGLFLLWILLKQGQSR